MKTSLKAGLMAGALAFAANGFSNELAGTGGEVAGGARDVVENTAKMEAAKLAADTAARAAYKKLLADIVTQIAQSINPELGVALGFLTNTGNYKGLSPGKILRNITSKYSNLKASEELARFARKNGLTLQELNLILITSSFIGNEIVGSRYKDKGFLEDRKGSALSTDVGAQGIKGMFDRVDGGLISSKKHSIINKLFSAPFDVIDVMLGYQGLLTASSFDFIRNGRSGDKLYGHSLGTLDASNLLSRGFVSDVHLDSLPFGFIAPVGAELDIGTGDFVNGFFLGKITNPWANLVNISLGRHALKRYHSLPKK